MKLNKNIMYLCALLGCVSQNGVVFAGSSREELQKSLNDQVLAQPYSVQDDATLSKSLDDATERGKPSKSKTQDGYYRYFYNGYYYPNRYWYNGAYYPHPYSYYRHYGYWY